MAYNFETQRQQHINNKSKLSEPKITSNVSKVGKSIISPFTTIFDVAEDVFSGAIKSVEGIADYGLGLLGSAASWFGSDNISDAVSNAIKYDFTNNTVAKIDDWAESSSLLSGNNSVSKITHQVASGVGEMLPALVATYFTGGAAGTVVFGAGAAGGSTEQALNEGASIGQATSYGTLSGITEGAIEYASGKLGGTNILGKGAVGKVFSSGAGKVAKTFAEEGLEEVASDVINPYLKRATYKDTIEMPSFEELANSFVVGGLTAVTMGGAAKTSNVARYGVKGEQAVSKYNQAAEINSEMYELEKKGKLTSEKKAELIKERNNLLTESGNLLAEISNESKKIKAQQTMSNFDKIANFDAQKQAIYETIDLMNKKYKTDIKVQFVGKDTLDKFANAKSTVDGYIDNKTNTIYINESASDPYSVVVAHEITHTTENNQLYNELAKDILSTMSEQELSSKRNELSQLYEGATTEMLDKEIVADYVSKMLGSDTKTLLNTFTRKPNIVTKVFKWIESKLAKMSQNSAEYDEYRKLRDKFRKVLSNENVSVEKSGQSETLFSRKSRNVDSQGNELSEQQQEYFKDSKVRDENGNLMVVYHGTNSDFNKFEHRFMGQSGTSYGYGFYFTNNEEIAKGYGSAKPYFLNITKPLSINENEITKTQLKTLLRKIDPDGNGMLSDFDDVSYYGYEKVLDKAVDQLLEYNENDVDIVSEIVNLNGGGTSSAEIYSILKSTLGYDGIITGYHTGDNVFVAFNSNDIKLSDNKNPTESDDIRFSRKSRKPPEGQTTLELDFETKQEPTKVETAEVQKPKRESKSMQEYNKRHSYTDEDIEKYMEQTRKQSEVVIANESESKIKQAEDKFKNFIDAAKNGKLFTYLKVQLVDSASGVRDKLSRKYKDNKELRNEKIKQLNIEIDKTRRATARADWYIGTVVDSIWKPIEAKGEAYTRDFQDFMLHKLNIKRMGVSSTALNEIAELNKELNSKLEKLEKDYNEGKYKKKLDYELDASKIKSQYKAKIDTLEEELKNIKEAPVFGEDITAEISKKAVAKYRKEHPEFDEHAEKVADVFESLKKKRLEAGLITQEQYDLMTNKYGRDYVPTYRVNKDGISTAALSGNMGVRNGLHRAKGSDKDIRSIMVQMCEQVIGVEKQASMNELFNVVKEMLPEEFSDDKIVSREKASRQDVDANIIPEKNQVFFYENGERVVYQVDNEVASLFQSMRNIPSQFELGIFGKASQGLVKLTRNVTTQYNPFFAARNLFRDYFDAVIYTKNKGKFNQNYVESAKDVLSHGKWYKMYMENGGASASFYSKEQGRDMSKKGFLSKIAAFNESIELIPRVAEMKATYERLTAEGVSHEQAIQEAMFDAAEVTVNFGSGGVSTKWLSRNLIPYLNGAVQGSAKFFKTFVHPESFNQWVSSLARAGMMAIPAIILNEALFGDDEDYEELSEDVKSGYYLFKVADNKFIRIPRGRIESIFGDFAQRTIRYTKGDKDAFNTYGETVKTAVSPVESFTRTVFSPFTDVKTNVAWHGGKIESSSMQNKPVQERYDENTSEIAKVLSKAFPKLSPKKWHYLLDQYSGVIGDIVLPLTSKSASVENVLLKSSGYYVNSLKNNKYTNQFYNLGDELTQAKNSANATGVDKAKLRYYNKMSGKINELYKAKDGLNGDEADATQLLIVQMQRQTIDNLKTFSETLEKYNYGLSDEDLYDEYYREATRECFGAEIALMDYDSNVYEKATIFNNCGIDWNTFYNIYFDAKDIKPDYDDNGKAISGSKKQKVTKYVKSLNLTATQKYMVMGLLGYKNANGKEQVHSLLRSKGYSGEKLNEIMKLCGYGD